MIVVIADDFTGAAEIAGISLRYGFTVDLFTSNILPSNADVVIVSTDTRSLPLNVALVKYKKILEQLTQLNPSFFYKKIDSVLRGYVAEEINLHFEILNKTKAFVLPANPSLGRIIKNGKYFINNIEIDKTNFANDPEFPIKSSFVNEIIKGTEITIANVNDQLPNNGIVIGNAATTQCMEDWTKNVSNDWLLSGAGDFYESLLQQKYALQNNSKPFDIATPFLFVAGSTFNNSLKVLQHSSLHKTYLSSCLYCIAVTSNVYILAIDDSKVNINPLALRTAMAIETQKIIFEKSIKEIFIEGGSTAASILDELKIDKFEPTNELSRGVVRMKANKLFITVKPGSYTLPNIIKELYENKL